MAHIQSGEDTTLATVDPTTKSLYVTSQETKNTSFSHDDFTLDSFERLRVSDARIVFESNFGAQTPSQQTTIWESTAYGAGSETLTTNLYGTDLATTTASGTGRWIQSLSHVRYAPGVSTLFRFTCNFNGGGSNTRYRIGMFTDQGTFPSTAGDRAFIELDGTTLYVVRRYMTQGVAGSEEKIIQSSWNKDKMDGTGASGVTLDLSMTQHLIIEYQWLGVGTIRFGFECGSRGTVWCHEITSVNNLSESWCRTGTLPIRAEVYTYGTAPTIERLTIINCVVLQEGDVYSGRGWRYFSGTSGSIVRTVGTATGLYPILALRATSTNDLTKRTTIIPVKLSIVVTTASTGGTSLQLALLMNPTPMSNATFAVTTTGSTTSIDNGATATTAVTGTTIFSAILPNTTGVRNFDLPFLGENMNRIGYNAAGTVSITGSSVLTLALGVLTGTASVAPSVAASITWKEIS